MRLFLLVCTGAWGISWGRGDSPRRRIPATDGVRASERAPAFIAGGTVADYAFGAICGKEEDLLGPFANGPYVGGR